MYFPLSFKMEIASNNISNTNVRVDDYCDLEKDSITVEPVYFEKRGIHKYIDFKKLPTYSFYGAFSAIVFIYYIKMMSSPILSFLFTIFTTFIVGYSTIGPTSFDHLLV